jgi:hypothetical protein
MMHPHVSRAVMVILPVSIPFCYDRGVYREHGRIVVFGPAGYALAYRDDKNAYDDYKYHNKKNREYAEHEIHEKITPKSPFLDRSYHFWSAFAILASRRGIEEMGILCGTGSRMQFGTAKETALICFSGSAPVRILSQ